MGKLLISNCVVFLFLMNTLPQRQLPAHDSGVPCGMLEVPPNLTSSPLLASPPSPEKGAKKSTYSSKAHHWRSAIGGGGGSGSRAHLGRDVVEAGIGAGAGEGAVHLMVAHHGKGGCVGAGDGDGRAQGRGCKEAGISGRAPTHPSGQSPGHQASSLPSSNPFCVQKLPAPGSPPRLNTPNWDLHFHSLKKV